MRRFGFLFLSFLCAGSAEVRTITLQQAIELALKQGPDAVLARLDERKAEENVRLARSPFIPKVVVGSGLAYSSGFPMSIEGASPSILQANGVGSVFNLPQNYRVAAAKESRRGAAIDTGARQDEAAYRVAELYLEAEKAAKVAEVARRDVEASAGVVDAVRARVTEGRELPIEGRKAELTAARARYRMQALEANVRALEASLATLLGFNPDDQAHPSGAHPAVKLPESPDAAVQQALKNSKELRSLESKMLAKGYDIRAERAGRWPKLDLVAQYGLLAKFNNYDKFFRAFQRHNGQLGISFQVPLWNAASTDAAASQAEAESAQLGVQVRTARSRIAADTRRAYDDVRQAESVQELARMDLDVAREEVSILLAQMQEGRAGLRQVEQARSAETEKWIAFYDSAANLDKTRLAVLRQMGVILAVLQ